VRPGEALHRAGDEGARRAKRWLESTTRVKTVWLNTDPRQAGRMTFKWPHNPENYSFDFSGLFHRGEINGDHFTGESKAYTNNNNHQSAEYRSFLAKCYCTELYDPSRFDHYLFMTSHPFSVNDWSILDTPKYVTRCVLEERKRALGIDDIETARQHVQSATVESVAGKLFLLLMNKRDEQLQIFPEDRALIVARAVEEGTL
jgi:hypothetical protein